MADPLKLGSSSSVLFCVFKLFQLEVIALK